MEWFEEAMIELLRFILWTAIACIIAFDALYIICVLVGL